MVFYAQSIPFHSLKTSVLTWTLNWLDRSSFWFCILEGLLEEVFREVTLKRLKCPRICEELFSATQMHRTRTAEPRGGCANRRLCSRDVPTFGQLTHFDSTFIWWCCFGKNSTVVLSSFSVAGGFKCLFPQWSSSHTFLSHKRVQRNALENEHFLWTLALLHHHTHTSFPCGKLPISFILHPSGAGCLDFYQLNCFILVKDHLL